MVSDPDPRRWMGSACAGKILQSLSAPIPAASKADCDADRKYLRPMNYKPRAQIRRDPIQFLFVLTMLGAARAALSPIRPVAPRRQFGASVFSLWPPSPGHMIGEELA